MELSPLMNQILACRDERDWVQFHTPRNLATALAVAVAELQELMLWKGEVVVDHLVSSKNGHSKLSDEIADVMIYALLFCEAAGIDPEAAVRIKLKKNGEKYPVEKAKGSAAKYTEL